MLCAAPRQGCEGSCSCLRSAPPLLRSPSFFAFDRNRAQEEIVLSAPIAGVILLPAVFEQDCSLSLPEKQRNVCSQGRGRAFLLSRSSLRAEHRRNPVCELHGADKGCASMSPASLVCTGREMDPARYCLFPHLLHAPGSAVLFKTACCFSSTRDIISVHTARFIEGWRHAKESKFRFNKKRDPSQQARFLHAPGLADILFPLCC